MAATSFMGSTLLRTTQVHPIAQKVEQAKADLINSWDEKLRAWEELQPQVIPYRGRFPTKVHAARQTGARLSVYRIHPATVVSEAKDGIQAEVESLAGRVLQEIAQDVQDTWKPGASQASRRIKNLLKRLASKCRTLEFLGGNLGSMASFIEEAIRRLPTEGPIQGADFAVLAGILSILSSPEKMQNTSLMIEAESMASVESLFAKPAEVSFAEAVQEEIPEPSKPAKPAKNQNSSSEAWAW